MSAYKEIIFAGSGGQGVLTVGLLMAEMALYKGLHATWIPQYGSAMRGGARPCARPGCIPGFSFVRVHGSKAPYSRR